MTERFFAPCPRGLEVPLGDELAALDAGGIARTDGGVAFEGPLELAYRANLESRLASRVLWRVGGGRYRDEKDVHALARSVPWPRLFRGDRLRVEHGELVGEGSLEAARAGGEEALGHARGRCAAGYLSSRRRVSASASQ